MVKYLKSKTVNFGLIVSILGVIQSNIDSLGLDSKTQGFVLIGIGIAVILLRSVTDKPLKDK